MLQSLSSCLCFEFWAPFGYLDNGEKKDTASKTSKNSLYFFHLLSSHTEFCWHSLSFFSIFSVFDSGFVGLEDIKFSKFWSSAQVIYEENGYNLPFPLNFLCFLRNQKL